MKSWQLVEQARATLSKEVGYVLKTHAGRLRVALAFPNTYFVGMSNLGFQTVYQLFNAQDDVVCERLFLPPKQQLKEQLEGLWRDRLKRPPAVSKAWSQSRSSAEWVC